MNSKRTDISQVKKYLNQELSARAMHKLEREALDDPFLLDALQGYEINGKNQQQNIDALCARLRQRTAVKRSIITWVAWPAAAAVILALTIGGLLLKKAPTAGQQRTAATAGKPVVKQLPDTLKNIPPGPVPLAAEQASLVVRPKKKHHLLKDNSVYQQEISAADNKAIISSGYQSAAAAQPVITANAGQDTPENDNIPVNDMVVMGYLAHAPKKHPDSAAHVLREITMASAPLQSQVPASVDGLVSISSKDANVSVDARLIAGTIISKQNGEPVIGAAIRVNGTNKSTVTDVNGRFSLASPADKTTLDIISIGYAPKQVTTNGGDSLKVELNENDNNLKKTVTGNSPERGPNPGKEINIKTAHPQYGWESFNSYLQANALLSNNTDAGTVTVSFTVDAKGMLGNFTIQKGISEAADQKAIALIRNGPLWTGNSNGKARQVTVKVKFQAQQ